MSDDESWGWTIASAGILTILSFALDYYSKFQYTEEMKYSYGEEIKHMSFPDTLFAETVHIASMILLQLRPTG